MSSPELEYNVASMLLKGNIDGFVIDTIAYSGGRGGSTTPGAVNDVIRNNPFLSSLKYDDKKKGSFGGPLPSGIYKLLPYINHEVELIPVNVVNSFGRDKFLIHGHGPKGSRGCIVPQNRSALYAICNAVKERQSKGKHPFTIQVYATGDLDYYLRKLHTV